MDTAGYPTSTSKGEDEKELVDLQTRLEALLSTKSLAEDAFLKQHMNAQTYIPLVALSTHPSLQDLLQKSPSIITSMKAAAERSDKMSANEDGTMIRPLLKPRRNTLILRDLPDSPEDELRTLFASSPESDAFVSLKPDVNNTAFVTFKSEEAAQNAALWLRSQKLRGAEIKCAIKSEHLVRSFVPASPGPSMQPSPYMMPQYQTNLVWVPGKEWGDPGNWVEQPMTAATSDGSKGKGQSKGMQIEPLPPAELPQSVTSTPLLRPQEPETFEFVYKGAFRMYSRQQIIDVCSAMDKIPKPDTYKQEEKNGVALFRASANRDWAPLPSPATLLRESDLQEPGSRKNSWNSDAKRRSRSQSMDRDDSTWARGDSHWWKPTGRPTSKWVTKGKGVESSDRPQKWVEKGRTGVEASPTLAPAKAPTSDSPSWADKVRLGVNAK